MGIPMAMEIPEIWPFGSPRFLVANKGPQGLIAAVYQSIDLEKL